MRPTQYGSGRIRNVEYIRKSAEFAHVKKHGRVYSGRTMLMQMLPAPDQLTRLGIIVTKNYSRSAVTRNRARRLIRESFRLTRHAIRIPAWLVIVARKGIAGKETWDVQQELLYFLGKAQLLDSSCTGRTE